MIDDEELKEDYAHRQPYGEWLDSNLIHLADLKIPNQDVSNLYQRRMYADCRKPSDILMKKSKSSILTYGTDTGQKELLRWVSMHRWRYCLRRDQPLFGYFKQLFAQVTNPPIDAIREEVVTSTTIYVGSDGNLLEEKEENCKMLKVNNPILTRYGSPEDQEYEGGRLQGSRNSDYLL